MKAVERPMGYRVLVVEDEADLFDSVVRAPERAGTRPIRTTNGRKTGKGTTFRVRIPLAPEEPES